ncbi:uncharacterized protein METZ01_LOCUS191174 [marine metagenome]|uniref:Uncharacterized protein n=1 Tax=marine metagenome TaxID=408172 RepID=A0A382DIM6_9ZZZZ
MNWLLPRLSRVLDLLSTSMTAVFALTLLSTPVFIDDVIADGPRPDEAIRMIVSQLVNELESNRLALEADRDQLYALVNEVIWPHLATEKISKLILGAHFKAASAEQRQRFSDAFMALMVRTYATAMFEYTGREEIVFEPYQYEPADRTSLVQTRIALPGQAPVPVDYAFLRFKNGHWKIYDVKIDGISLVLSYRRSYNQIIRTQGLDSLIEALRAQSGDS